MKLENKVALITGAGRGIGAAIARTFALEGAKVCVTDVDERGVCALAQELGSNARFARQDVALHPDWLAVAELAHDAFGGLDILVNNAGIVELGRPIVEMNEDDFRRVLNVNVVGAWLGIQTIAPAIAARGGGAIINIASIMGTAALAGASGYVTSKWALRGLNKAAALELGTKGIRVNAILPGTIATEMSEMANADTPNAAAKYAHLPLARRGEADEIAAIAVLLASDGASYMTGTEVVVDGGHTAMLTAPRPNP